MKHTIKHNLPHDRVKMVTEKAFEGYRTRFAEYNPSATWVTENRSEIKFSAKGITLQGFVDLKPNEIELELEVPFLFRIFKGQALEIIENEIRKWLGKAEAGEI